MGMMMRTIGTCSERNFSIRCVKRESTRTRSQQCWRSCEDGSKRSSNQMGGHLALLEMGSHTVPLATGKDLIHRREAWRIRVVLTVARRDMQQPIARPLQTTRRTGHVSYETKLATRPHLALIRRRSQSTQLRLVRREHPQVDSMHHVRHSCTALSSAGAR